MSILLFAMGCAWTMYGFLISVLLCLLTVRPKRQLQQTPPPPIEYQYYHTKHIGCNPISFPVIAFCHISKKEERRASLSVTISVQSVHT